MQPLVYIKVFFLYVFFFETTFLNCLLFQSMTKNAGNGLTFSSDGWLEETRTKTVALFNHSFSSSAVHTQPHVPQA